jgi:hypothetical protein
LGLAESFVTTSSQSFTFNADNQFVTIGSNVSLYIKPSNWPGLVPAIQASSQIKLKIFLPSGPEFIKFLLRDMVADSGFFITLNGTSPNILLRFLLLQDTSSNGNFGQAFYTFTEITDLLSVRFPISLMWNTNGGSNIKNYQEIRMDTQKLKYTVIMYYLNVKK